MTNKVVYFKLVHRRGFITMKSEKKELKRDYVYRLLLQRLSQMPEDGSRLPSEPELSRELNVSRATLRYALERLEHEGRISRSHYYGTRPMTSGNSMRILLIGDMLANGECNLQRVVSACITKVAAEHGFHCDEIPRSFLREPEVISKRYRGVIFFGAALQGNEPWLSILHKCTIPVVYCREDYENRTAGLFSSVGTDSKQAWLAGLNYLVACGCRRILTLLSNDERNKVRLGWHSAVLAEKMREMGLDESAELIWCTDRHEPDFFSKLDNILEDGRIDAVQCYSDGHAMWVYDAVQRVGKKIPRDVMVLGYDGFPGGELVRPTLASLEYPVEQCARAALWLIQHSSSEPQHITLPVLIRPGESIRASIFANLANSNFNDMKTEKITKEKS